MQMKVFSSVAILAMVAALNTGVSAQGAPGAPAAGAPPAQGGAPGGGQGRGGGGRGGRGCSARTRVRSGAERVPARPESGRTRDWEHAEAGERAR